MSVAAHTPAPVSRLALEADLRAAMLAYMEEFGFTRLRVTYTVLEGEIARSHRMELAAQGWIA